MKKERHVRKRKSQDDEAVEEVSTASCVEGIRALQKRRAQKLSRDAQHGNLREKVKDQGAEQDVFDAYVKEKSQKTTSETQEMDRFIEHHMKQRLGHLREDEGTNLTPDQERDKELFEVPDSLKASEAKEVSIPGLMTGISEVRLPLSCRLKNIEETEKAKVAILETGSLDCLRVKKRRTEEEDEEDANGVKRSMFASSFGRTRG